MNAPRSRLLLFLFGLATLHGLVVNLMPVMFTTMEETFHLNKSNRNTRATHLVWIPTQKTLP